MYNHKSTHLPFHLLFFLVSGLLMGLSAPVDVLTTSRKPEMYVQNFRSVIFLRLGNTWEIIGADFV